MAEGLLSPEDVARHCGLSRKAVYRAIERRELPAAKLCSRLRIRPEDVERWIESNRLADALVDRSLLPTPMPAANGLRALVGDARMERVP